MPHPVEDPAYRGKGGENPYALMEPEWRGEFRHPYQDAPHRNAGRLYHKKKEQKNDHR